MSSLTAGPSPSRRTAVLGGVRARAALASRAGTLLTLGLAALLIATAFVARGGSALGRTTTVTIGLALLGAGAIAAAVVMAPPRPRVWGGVTVALFGALVVVTGLSIAWSIQPSDSWVATSLTLAYFAAFAGAAALARLAPARWSSLLGAVLIASVVVSGYALLAKVFPSMSPLDLYARLRSPFDYWNGVGLMAALGIPACLWLGARREGHGALNALAVPALGLLLVALLLSYGRGPVLAALVATACWFAAVPLRLRGAAVLATAGAGAAVVCAWTFSNDALTTDGTPMPARAHAGHELGLLLVALLVVLLAAGLALAFAMARTTLASATRRQLGAAVLAALALAALGGIGAVAASQRGLKGSVSHAWHQLTDPNAVQPPNEPGRLASVGGMRARYWDDALKIWRRARWIGVGADGYATGRRAIQRDRLRVRHAHGYVPQTLADLGLLGLGVSLALLAAWLLAAARATGLWWRRGATRLPVMPERIGLLTLGTTAIAFGVHSAVDWTWFVPGTAVVGMVCAGWLAGRGPLSDAPVAGAAPGSGWAAERGRLALAAVVIAAGAAGAWAIWQPLRAAHASDAALTALDAGRLQDARADAERAARIDPLSIDPLLYLAAIESAGRQSAQARATLQRAVRLQPANPEPWLRLGQFELDQGRPRVALQLLNAAVYLDPQSPATQVAYAQAQQAASAR